MAEFKSPRIAVAIPTPEPTMDSVLACIGALKQAVEFMMGVNTDTGTARVFVMNEQPTAHNQGDIWITSNPTSTLSYWNGATWQVFAVAHSDGTLHSS